MPNRVDLFSLIERLYDASLDSSRWAAFLEDLSTAVDGIRPTLFEQDPVTHVTSVQLWLHSDQKDLRAYHDYYQSRNVWLQKGSLLLRSGVVRTSHMMCAESELRRTEFFNDFAKPLGFTQGLGGTMSSTGRRTFNVAVFAGAQREPFGESELRLLATLMPHMQRAFQIQARISTRPQSNDVSLVSVLESSTTPVMLLDRRQRVVFANPASEALLAANSGLEVKYGRLDVRGQSESARLASLVSQACLTSSGLGTHAGGVVRLSASNGRQPRLILVAPLSFRSVLLPGEPKVILFFVQTKADDAEPSLRQRFAFTSAEVKVGMLLAQGHSVAEIAEKLDVSLNTVRTHLSRAFSKTSTTRQGELITKILRHLADHDLPSITP